MNKFFRLLTLGELTGFVSGVLIVSLWPWTLVVIEQPTWLLLAIVMLAAATSLLVAVATVRQGLPSPVTVRRGVGAAAVSSVVAASLFALMARRLPGLTLSFRALLAGWLSVMPAMLAGMVSSCLGVVLCQRPSVAAVERHDLKFLRWGLRGVVGLLAIAWAMVPIREPAPEVSTPVGSAPERPVSEPPPWNYVPPTALDTAHALQWRLKDQRELSDALSSTAVLSKDDRWLGYVSMRDHALVAVELNHPANTRRVPLPHGFDSISFAPDGNRVFLVSHGENIELGVADFSTERYTALPKPRHFAMPEGKVAWWQNNYVMVQTRRTGDWMVNLETLEVEKADSIEVWKSLNPDQRNLLAPEFAAMPATPRWSWERKQVAFSVELPEELQAADWQVKGGWRLCLQHPQYDARTVFRSINLDGSDRLLATRDGSKVVRVQSGSATIFYYDIEPCPALQWKVVSPLLPPGSLNGEHLQAALKDGTLAAYVYAPLINPLNNKLVGPDRSEVRGVVSVRDWKDSSMTVYATEVQGTLDHAVIADLHVRARERLELVKLDTSHRWWAELSDVVPDSGDVTRLPTRSDKAKQFTDARQDEKRVVQAREEAARNQREAEVPKIEPKPLQTTLPANISQAADDPVKQFILSHHKKSEQGDARALVADYADRVDYFSDGVVTSSHILRDELQYHQTHRVLEERVEGEIRVNKLNATGFTATYLLRTKSLDLQKGATKEGTFEENLIIVQTPAGLRIARQRAEKKP